MNAENEECMSWSLSLVGKAANVAKALEEHVATLSGQNKIEYDDAKDSLIRLVNQNFAKSEAGGGPAVRLNASGYGDAVDGHQVARICAVSIEPCYNTKLV